MITKLTIAQQKSLRFFLISITGLSAPILLISQSLAAESDNSWIILGNAKEVVLTHVSPLMFDAEEQEFYTSQVRETFGGNVIVANDLDNF